MYTSPVSSQHEEVVEHILSTEGIDEHIENTRTRPFRIRFKNESRVEFRSFEKAKNIRSKGVHYLIVDESQDVKLRTFETVARPLVSANYGSILLLGQFRGRDWRYKQYFEPGQATPGTPENPLDFGAARYASWKIPSRMGPAYQSERGRLELLIAKSQMAPWSYAQEYECDLCANPNAAFRADYLQRIKSGTPQASRGGLYVMGLDIGRVVDCSAAVILNVLTGEVEHTENFPLGMEHALQARRAAEISRTWNDALVVLDATGGGAPAKGKGDEYIKLYREACKRHRMLYQTWQNKHTIMECLSLQIEQQKINIPATHAALHEELEQYEVEYKGGYWRFHGEPDNLVSALSMAVYARKEGWVTASSGQAVAWL